MSHCSGQLFLSRPMGTVERLPTPGPGAGIETRQPDLKCIYCDGGPEVSDTGLPHSASASPVWATTEATWRDIFWKGSQKPAGVGQPHKRESGSKSQSVAEKEKLYVALLVINKALMTHSIHRLCLQGSYFSSCKRDMIPCSPSRILPGV